MKRAVLISGLTALALAGTAVVGVAASHGKADMGGHMGGFMGERGAMMSFDDVDTDADGKITAAELKAHADARFAEADTDKDGFLSAEEMQAHMLAQASARMQERSARMIEMMDADGDGKISAAEMQEGPRRGDRFERMMSRLDRDEDGAVSRDEMDEARERWSDRRDGHGMGHGMMHGMGNGMGMDRYDD